MKPIRYARHAKRRVKEREVTEEQVDTIINMPESVEPSIKGRKNAYKFIGGRFFRVTFKEENDYILVVTVTVRKRPFKR